MRNSGGWRSVALQAAVILLTLAGGWLSSGHPSWSQEPLVTLELPQLEGPDHPKIQNALEGLLLKAQRGSSLLKSFPRDPSASIPLAFSLKEDRIQVIIQAISPKVTSDVAGRVRGLGGQVEIIQGELIQASMPLSAIRKLADYPNVTFVRLPVRARLQTPPQGPISPDPKKVRSEGVPAIGADAWREAGFDGTGVKIGIIDPEFGLYEQLLGRELPPSERVTARSFIDHGQMYDPRGPEELQVHGTAAAEIITDIAPGATLYLAAFNTDVELKAAISWMIQQKVDVISSSIGIDSGCFNPEGGIFASSIKQAKEAGITWATAAGNEADVHWEGTFTDPDGDRIHNFSGTDEGNTLDVVLREYEYSDGTKVATAIIFAVYSWEAPCTGAQDDYELIVYREEGGRLILLPPFDGSVGQVNDWYWEPRRPIKVLFATEDFPASQVGQIKRYQIQIRKKRSSATNARLDVMFYSCQGWCRRIEYTETSGSVGIEEPSISPYVITVGAVHHSTSCARNLCPDGRLLFYSSRGPTKDGRIKPDIAAPSHVSTYVYGRWTGDREGDNFGFTGTSAATPHVAGAAALAVQVLRAQLGRDPTPDEVQRFLEERAEDMGAPGKDNAYGAGILALGQPPAGAAPPNAPSNLKAEAQGPREISLTWQDNSDNEEGFKVLRDGQEIATLPPDTEQYLDTQGLQPGTRYCYRVVAFNDAGDSEPSNEACATTLAENRPPVADAGPDRTVFVGETVQLDGSGSSDPDGDPLSFRWAFVSKPEGSQATLSTPTEAQTTFVPDVAGQYVVKLTVDDGRGGTASDTVTITAETLPTYEYEGRLQLGELGRLEIPEEIKQKLPEMARYVERPHTTHEGERSDSLAQVGLRLSPSTGTIFGKPTQAGRFRFLIEVQDTQQNGRTAAFLWARVTVEAPQPPTGEALIALAFVKLEFLQPEDWKRELRDGCVIYTNISQEPSPIRVTLVDGSVHEYAIPAGREVIVCGNIVHIDTRPKEGS